MKRNKFNLSYNKLFSCNMGELIPFGLTEVLPGDTIQHTASALVRCSPLLAPVMHPVRVAIHHWFVPHRLVWEDFEDFITGGPSNTDASVFPTITMAADGGAAVGSLADYLGVPTGVDSLAVSALPFRGYAEIWNEFYRDQDLQTPLTVDYTSGADTTTSTALQNAAWEKDYFTSARPFEQKGPSITIPIGTTAPVVPGGSPTPGDSPTVRSPDAPNGPTPLALNSSGDVVLTFDPAASGAFRWVDPKLRADLTGASAVTITALREAMALQRYAEARARYGSRYTEYLSYLGVRSSDARLQRPEYLGGGRETIQFSEVLQTAEGTNPVGELRGHGINATRSNRYRRFFEEHGYIHSFMVIRPKTIYQQGLFRHWNRRVKEDFHQRELEHVGQQEVLYKEVYAGHATPDGIFGYQDRYDEYRRSESLVSGEFRTTDLNYWHMAREFESDPALNSSFVSSVPTKRVFAVTDPNVDSMYVTSKHSIQARRMLSRVGKSFIY